MVKYAIVDLDDTIVDLVPDLIKVCNLMSGKSLTMYDWTVYDVFTTYGITHEAYWDTCVREHLLENAQPIELAREAMAMLFQKGYAVHFLTARGWHPNGRSVTYNWLYENKILFDELHIVDLNTSKAEYIKTVFGNVSIAIDDNSRHINEILDAQVSERTFMIDQPWNTHVEALDPWRIGGISELLRFAEYKYI